MFKIPPVSTVTIQSIDMQTQVFHDANITWNAVAFMLGPNLDHPVRYVLNITVLNNMGMSL